MHGGEGQNARDKFDALSETRKEELISFLYSLRTPVEQETQHMIPSSMRKF